MAKKQMRTLALLARKGGAGKTTLSVHLAVLAQQAGLRTLILDLDPQRSAGDWWRSREADAPELVETEPARVPEILAAAADDGVDLVVVDTRPSAEADALAVARVAGFALVPTRPAILDMRAIGATVDVVKAAGIPAGLVINSAPAGRGDKEASLTADARRGLESYGLPVAPVSIGARAALSHALIDGRAVTEFEPEGKASAELRALWTWLEKQKWR